MKIRYLVALPLALLLMTGCVEIKVEKEGCECCEHHEKEKEGENGNHKDKEKHKEKEDAEDEEGEEGGHHDSKADLMKKTKVSEAAARRTAMKRVPNGTIKEGELEMENGHLQWSFDIATPDSTDITEVNVDAISGKIIDVSKEKPEKDEGKEREKDKEDKD